MVRLKRQVPLILLYFCAVTIRFLLATEATSYPVLYIDEFLYSNLGRSIVTSGKLLFNGQPANYSYILYPLLIAPAYLFFPEGSNFYRIIQLWNIILMSLTIFPFNALCKKLLRDNRKAFIATAICMLLPDFMLGQYIFSEAILYPLFFGLIYCICIYIEEKTPGRLLYIGILGGLMYCTKPGSVAPAVLFLIMALAGSIARKEKKTTLAAAGGFLSFFAVILFFWCLAKFAFGYSGNVFSIYDIQVANSGNLNLGIFLQSAVTYPYYFILSCGIIGFVLPFLSWKSWDNNIRKFWWFTLVSLFFMMVGTAWVINRPEENANLLHIRYSAIFIPLVFLFCFLPGSTDKKKLAWQPKAMIGPGMLLAFILVSTIIWGSKTGARSPQIYPLMSLIVLTDNVLPLSSQIIGDIIIIVLTCSLFFLYYIKRPGKLLLQRICISFVALFMLINGICGYVFVSRDNVKALAEDGMDALRLTDGHDFIYLKTLEGQLDGGININTKRNPDVVLMNDLMNHLSENQGRYIPFVPVSLRGYKADVPTADTDTLLLDDAAYPLVKINASAATAQLSKHTWFSVIHFTPGERVFDSIIGEVFNGTLSTNKPGVLLIFNQELLQKSLTIRMEIKSSKAQVMKIFCSKEMKTIELHEGQYWYETTFNKPEDAFNFVVEEENIVFYGYELLN